MTKDTIDLQRAVKNAYDNVVEMKEKLRVKCATGPVTTAFLGVHDAAYTEYDELVDLLVEASGGDASAANTDPLTYSRLLPCTAGGMMTYNQMCEIIGASAFGH